MSLAATSSAWLGVPYNLELFTENGVGKITLDFTDATFATMTYTLNGIIQTKRIERLVY